GNCRRALGGLAVAVSRNPLHAQADTVGPPRPVFTRRDGVLAAGFVVGTIAARPVDSRAAAALQRPLTQKNRVLQDVAVGVRTIADPGPFIIGISRSAAGRV